MARFDHDGHRSLPLLEHPYRSPASDLSQAPRRPWLHRIGPAVLISVGLAVVLGCWIWMQGAQARALAALPAAERAQLLGRTLEDLRLCRDEAHQTALRAYCEKQAELARAFPECTGECRALALPWTGPRRH